MCWWVTSCICKRVMSHTSSSHVSYMNEPFYIHECIILYFENQVISHTWLSRIIYYINKLSHIHQWFMSYIWMSHVTYINASFHLYEWVISRPSRSQFKYVWMKHVTYISASCQICHKSCHIRPWVMSRIWMSLFYIHQRVMSWVWISHLTCIIESCRTSITCEWSCHIHSWVTSHVWTSHLTYINASRHIYEWVMSQTSMRYAIYTNESRHIHSCVMPYIRMSHVTYSNGEEATAIKGYCRRTQMKETPSKHTKWR